MIKLPFSKYSLKDLKLYYDGCLVRKVSKVSQEWILLSDILEKSKTKAHIKYATVDSLYRDGSFRDTWVSNSGCVLDVAWPQAGYYMYDGTSYFYRKIPTRGAAKAMHESNATWTNPLALFLPRGDPRAYLTVGKWLKTLNTGNYQWSVNKAIEILLKSQQLSLPVSTNWCVSVTPFSDDPTEFVAWWQDVPVALLGKDLEIRKLLEPHFSEEFRALLPKGLQHRYGKQTILPSG